MPTSAEKPTWLTPAQKLNVLWTASGWVRAAGSEETGCDDPLADQEVLVAFEASQLVEPIARSTSTASAKTKSKSKPKAEPKEEMAEEDC